MKKIYTISVNDKICIAIEKGNSNIEDLVKKYMNYTYDNLKSWERIDNLNFSAIDSKSKVQYHIEVKPIFLWNEEEIYHYF